MRITRLVPAGSVPLAATAGAEGGADGSGRITFSGLRVAVSGLRRRTGRSGSVSASEFALGSALRRVGPSLESELELEGALRRVGRLDEIDELHLGDRAHPHVRRAGGGADDRGLGDGRVDHASGTE